MNNLIRITGFIAFGFLVITANKLALFFGILLLVLVIISYTDDLKL
jgi:hypothetical protein